MDTEETKLAELAKKIEDKTFTKEEFIEYHTAFGIYDFETAELMYEIETSPENYKHLGDFTFE